MERDLIPKVHVPEVQKATIMWSLSLQFGWTPKQIRECDANDIEMYKAMLAGYVQGQRSIKK